jgi:hypothetical protein
VIFAEVLTNPRYAAMIKASVMISLGKVSYYMRADNPYFKAIHDILTELSTYDNILVSEPACYALTNIALSHHWMVRFNFHRMKFFYYWFIISEI